jgi:hypothetical protein
VHDGEAEAEPRAGGALVETLEHARTQLWRNPGAGIGHDDLDGAVQSACLESDGPATRELGRVPAEVLDCVTDEIGVAQHGEAGWAVDLDGHAFCGLQAPSDLAEQRLELDDLCAQLFSCRLSARENQHGAYELGQTTRFTFDVAEEEIAVCRLLRAGLEDVGCAHDCGQRRLELVGGVGDEVPLRTFVVVPPREVVKRGDGGDDLTGLIANGSGAHFDQQPVAVPSHNLEALG